MVLVALDSKKNFSLFLKCTFQVMFLQTITNFVHTRVEFNKK